MSPTPMNVYQLMAELQISKKTFYNWLRRGLPYRQVGRSRLVSLEAARQWYASTRAHPPSRRIATLIRELRRYADSRAIETCLDQLETAFANRAADRVIKTRKEKTQ